MGKLAKAHTSEVRLDVSGVKFAYTSYLFTPVSTSTSEIKAEQENSWNAVSQGDVSAFEQMYHRYYADLLRLSYRYVADEPTAKDIVQDLFLSIWEKRNSLTIRGSIRSYLLTACRNSSLNHLKRKASKWEELDNHDTLTSSATGADEDMAGKEMQLLIQEALSKLPPRCKTVFLLKREEGLTLRQIADQLEISPKTVENQMTRALKSLAKSLAKHMTQLLIFYYAVGDALLKIV